MSPFHRLLGVAVCLALTACDDLPTGPQVWTREAAGQQWVALAEPAGMPTARTWLDDAPAPAADSVRALLASAAHERGSGRLEVALATEATAAELSANSLSRAPQPVTLLGAMAAIDSWVERAGAPEETGRYPELTRDLALVRQLAGATHAALAAGDTVAAVVRVTRAANLARRWTPMAVASRAVVQAEMSIAAAPALSPEMQRARGLLRSAREGVASGDHARAVQRAMYALQLLDAARRR